MKATRIERALKLLMKGRPIIICDDQDREGEGDFAVTAKACTPEIVSLLLRQGSGLLCAVIDEEHAKKIGVRRLQTNGVDRFDTPFGTPIGLANSKSGISFACRAETLRAIAKCDATDMDFCFPGHISTLIANPGGLMARRGHTEAIFDLMRISDDPGPGVLCEILNEVGNVADRDYLEKLAIELDTVVIDIEDIASEVKVRSGGLFQ